MEFRSPTLPGAPAAASWRTALLAGITSVISATAAEKPNIIVILADDLGYGDVRCLNPERGKIPTPRIDRLARQGMIFTDAHSSSSVCTPTRYALLTGRYNWRSSLQSGVLPPYAKPLIDASRPTLPGMLRAQGYHTACIGKWHLGWDWPRTGKEVDFSRPIAGGPTTRGFDRYFGTDVPNYPPFAFIEDDRTVGLPTVPLAKELLQNNLASKPGLAVPGHRLESILPAITDQACETIRVQAEAKRPFFLYFALTSPHTPLAVNKPWDGSTGLGRFADLVAESDAMVGRVLDALDASGTAGNTLVIFTSDNGCAPYIGTAELEQRGHFPSGPLRGYKSDLWEGGHRIPFIARWPGRIQPDSRSGALVCQIDLMATCAEITGAALAGDAAPDSFSLLPALTGKGISSRTSLVSHSITGKFAIREGPWKLLFCPGSGGWSSPADGVAAKQGLPARQLYNLDSDPAEKVNRIAEQPRIATRLGALLEEIVNKGRSTPGPPQKNDVPIDLLKVPAS